MITLKNKTNQEMVLLTYQEYEKLPDLNNYEPIAVEGMVEIYKSDESGDTESYMITDIATAEGMQEQNPDLYPELELWEDRDLKCDFLSRTLSTEEFEEKLKDEYK